MSAADCIPLEQVPHTTRLFREFAESGTALPPALCEYYAAAPQSDQWMTRPLPQHQADIHQVADQLLAQNQRWGASPQTLANIAALRAGARAVITGQQVSLFGGPLYSLLKAATAVQLAAQASERGLPHVPIFWLATEDHDFAEVNTASFIQQEAVTTLHLCDTPQTAVPVGAWVAGTCLQDSVAEAVAALGPGYASDLLRECYAPGSSMADAFARLFLRLFADQGLIVVDASSRAMHALAAPVLAEAIRQTTSLHDALVQRSSELQAAGYHAQVLVGESSTLLFLLDQHTGERVALRRGTAGEFVAAGKRISEADLLQMLQQEPERLSPNALLRPVMQDFLLPTAAYVGGPAEIAYFAQAEVLYEDLLGQMTPVLPRLSATLVTPRVRRLLDRYELTVQQTWIPADALALRLGARQMPIEAKQHLQQAGNALHNELQQLEQYAASLDEGLGHTALVAASKMRYQMNRLRRMMARFELQRDDRLRHHATTLASWLNPASGLGAGGLQERKLSGMQFIADQGPALIERLVTEAADRCPSHKIITL